MDHVAGIRDDAGGGVELAVPFVALADEDAGVGSVVAGLAAEAIVEERGGQFGEVLFFAERQVGFVGLEYGLRIPAGEELVDREGEEKMGPFGIVGEPFFFFGFGGEAWMGGEDCERGDFARVFKGVAEREAPSHRVADEMEELEGNVEGFRKGRGAVAGEVEGDAGGWREMGAKRNPVEAGAEEAVEEDDGDARSCFQVSACKHEASRSFWNWWFLERSVKSSRRQVLEGSEERESVAW